MAYARHSAGWCLSCWICFVLPVYNLLPKRHIRRDLEPDMEVDVEILDVNEEEARKLLLSIDPLAALAETQSYFYERLLKIGIV
jgi:hypothetical protein